MALIRCGSCKTERLEYLKAQSLHSVNCINSFDLSTLCAATPYDKLKSILKKIIDRCFFRKSGYRRFQSVVLGYTDTYFVSDLSDTPQKYSDADVINIWTISVTTSLWSSADGYFNKQSAFQWVLIVLHYLPTCFYTRLRRIL